MSYNSFKVNALIKRPSPPVIIGKEENYPKVGTLGTLGTLGQVGTIGNIKKVK